jgi:hypothetical protein
MALCPIQLCFVDGRHNIRLEVYLRESQRLEPFVSFESKGTLPWLGSDRVQPTGRRSNDQHSPAVGLSSLSLGKFSRAC